MENKNTNFQKVIFALKDAFIALMPIFVLSSLNTVFYQLFAVFFSDNTFLNHLANSLQLINTLFPVLLAISISYHLGRIYEIGTVISITLALIVYFIIIAINKDEVLASANLSITNDSSFWALFVPMVTTYVMVQLSKLPIFSTKNYSVLGRDLSSMYQNTFVFIAGFVVVSVLFFAISYFFRASPFEKINLRPIEPVPGVFLVLMSEFIAGIIGFFGMHGFHTMGLFIDSSYRRHEVFPNLDVDQMITIFGGFGGAGAILSLIFAVIITAKAGYAKTVSKMALPFAIFNISELIVYGLPVIFNWRLFIPFVFVPMFNTVVAFVVLKLGFISFEHIEIPWSTPIFLNAYLMTGGNWFAILLQAILLMMDIYIYLPFVKNHLKTQSSLAHLVGIEKKLDIQLPMQARESIKFHQAQMYILNAHVETQKIVELITSNELMIYYQPKVSAKDLSCNHLEALLRLRMKNNSVVGPYFLDALAKAGLQPTIDYWVCKQIAKDIKRWPKQDVVPRISINLHPDTLQEDRVVQLIAEELSGLNVEFELLEKTFVDIKSENNIEYLISRGFTMAIDDFGTGYSSLESLNDIPAQVIKLDKGLIDAASTEKGRIIYASVGDMCKRIGFTLVAEGVETKQQYEFAKRVNVDYIQGFYFSKALSFEEAQQFIKRKPGENL